MSQKYAPDALESLMKIVGDETKPCAARVSAASAILKFSRESLELDDLGARLTAIEQRMNGDDPAAAVAARAVADPAITCARAADGEGGVMDSRATIGCREFGATITFAGNIEGVTRTIPSAIYTYSQTPGGDPAAVRLMGVSVLISLIALMGAQTLNRRIARWTGFVTDAEPAV